MKKLLFVMLLFASCPFVVWAQKTVTITQAQYQETQARMLDVSSNAYVKPLTVELKVRDGEKVCEIVKIPKSYAIVAMGNKPSNWKSYALYVVSKKLKCDVLVAATFNIKFDEVAGDTEVSVEVNGFPADYVNWKTATSDDMEWLRLEKLFTTDDAEKVGAAIRH